MYPKVTHNDRTSYIRTTSRALNVFLLRPCTPLHSSCTRDDLNELPSDDGLPCTVVPQGELVYHLTYKYKQKSHVGDSGDISDTAVDRWQSGNYMTVNDDELDNHMADSDRHVDKRMVILTVARDSDTSWCVNYSQYRHKLAKAGRGGEDLCTLLNKL